MRVLPFFKPRKGWHVAGTNLEPDSGGSYVLPVASADTLGGVKVGETMKINDGLLNYVPGQILPLVNLGTEYTAELKQDISSGAFKKAVVGGYLTINGHVYDFAHPDYWLNTGDAQCTTHHMLVVPRGCLVSGTMNSTHITTGAYVGSDFYTGNNSNTALADIKAIIKADFGEANILTHRELLANTVDASGNASNWAWYDSDIDLMNEQMVYGGACGSKPAADSVNHNMGIDKSQLKLFAERPDLITNRANWWLRSVVSASRFAFVNSYGDANLDSAGDSLGIRPAFAIC